MVLASGYNVAMVGDLDRKAEEVINENRLMQIPVSPDGYGQLIS